MKTKRFNTEVIKLGTRIGEQSNSFGIQILPELLFHYFNLHAGGFIDYSEKIYTISLSWLLWKVVFKYSIVDNHSETWTN